MKSQELEQIQSFEKKLGSPYKRKSINDNPMLLKLFPSIKEEHPSEQESSPPRECKPVINFTNFSQSKMSQLVEKKRPSISQSEKDKKKDVIVKFLVATSNPKIIKKLFIYQLKKSLLSAKKDQFIKNTYSISDPSMSPNTPHSQRTIPNTYDIFPNFSQINYSFLDSVIKYDFQNIQIGNYILYKNIVLGKGSFSTVFFARHVNTNKEYVINH
jgi:hypothetical protein